MRKLQVLFFSAFLLCLPFVFSCAGGGASSEAGSDVAIVFKTSLNNGERRTVYSRALESGTSVSVVISGNYSATATATVGDDGKATVRFSDVPTGASIRATACVIYPDNSMRYGSSSPIIVSEGENKAVINATSVLDVSALSFSSVDDPSTYDPELGYSMTSICSVSGLPSIDGVSYRYLWAYDMEGEERTSTLSSLTRGPGMGSITCQLTVVTPAGNLVFNVSP